VIRVAAAAVLALLLCGVAQASWSVGSPASGAAKAHTMTGGNVPSGSAAGSSVTLTWTASTFAGGTPIPGYVIRRFNSITQAEATVLASCSGTVSGTTCTENGVSIGSWKYTVTPAAGTWRGAQSAQSAAVVVTL
jgi:hypothetical protein